MILQAIEVKGWRCFANLCRVGEFATGINIVHAPNAAGKSTLFESLQRGLFDGHKAGGEAIDQLKSWGRDLAPSVQIDFVHRGVEYRLVKQFLRERGAQLYRRENGRYVLKAEGDSADLEARTIFAGEAAGRGGAREQHWGLAQVLWAPQGKLACSELPRGLINSIRGALDVQAADSASGAIEKEIERLYLETFSPNGRLRRGAGAPEWVRSLETLVNLREQRQAVAKKAVIWEEASGSVARHRQARELACEAEKLLEALFAQARLDALRFNSLRARKEKAAAEAAQHAARHRELSSRMQQLSAKAAELERSRKEAAGLADEIPGLSQAVKAGVGRTQQWEQALGRAREAHRDLEALRSELRAAEQFVASMTAIDRLGELQAKAEAVEAELKSLRVRHKRVNAPDDAALQSIREAIRSEVLARARLDAAAVTLQITLEPGARIQVLAGDIQQQGDLTANQPWQIKDVAEIVVRVPGVGEIKAFQSMETGEALKAELEGAVAKVAALTRAFGTSDLLELEQRHDESRRSAADVMLQQTRLQNLFGEEKPAAVAAAKAAHERSLAQFIAARGEWRDCKPDVAEMKRKLEQQVKASPDAEEAYKQCHEAQLNLASAQKDLAVAESRLANTTGRVSAVLKEIEGLQNDGFDDGGRAESLARIALEWSAATAVEEEAKRDLSAFEEDPAVCLQALEQRRESLRREAELHLSGESRARERLESAGALAPYTAAGKMDEEIAALEEAVAREKLQADAIKMLHETVKECRSAALTTVSAPVEAQALEIFHRVAGDPQVGAMHLGETFRLEQISPLAYGEPLPLENLSGGEKEQVHLAVRLALALVLAREERQLVVLDDVLIATDRERLERILDLLRDVARHLQIIILTCHPERYRRLADARFFDLERIKLG